MMRWCLSLFLVLWSLCGLGQADSLYEHAQVAYEAGQYQKAEDLLSQGLKLERTHYDCLKLRGDVRNRQSNFESALRDYNKAEKLQSQDPALYRSRGAALLSLYRTREAIKDFDRAVELDPQNPLGYYNRGTAYFVQGNYHKAVKEFDRALELNTNDADAYFVRGAALCELQDFKKGLADLNKANTMQPDNREMALHLAVMQFEAGEYKTAILALTKIIDSSDSEAEMAEAYYYRGQAKKALKNKVGACKDWTEAAQLGDDDSRALVAGYCEKDKDPASRKPRRKAEIVF
ncbi:MAG: tetratricopeptide repeat protein [Salibacteraceae bacterium]